MKLITCYRLSFFLHQKGFTHIAKLIYYIQYFLYNSSVPSTCRIGVGSKFAYGGISVVIHSNAVLGENVIIGQNTTIGGRSKQKKAPRIGNGVYIGAGARVLGDIEIGDDVVIGANAVVINSVPSNSIVAGVPARIIRRDINSEDYI